MIKEEMLCKNTSTLLDAMRIINENTMGLVFVVDSIGKLLGTITDGDIRRAILNDIELYDKVEMILSKDYIFGRTDESYDSLLKKISSKIKVIPLVNDVGIVVSFFEYEQKVNFPVAIPNLNGNEFKYLADAFMSTWISSTGDYLLKFEKKFSEYSDCEYGVTASNGTVALHLALLALDIGAGDEVIVPDFTFAATINTVLHANATPVIVDIEEESWCIDPIEIEKAITEKTKAIIPVHLYGQPCNMDEIMRIAKKYNLKVIEDCAQAHGATFDGQKVGSFGDIGCFSFYGNKVITTGEGGMCVTNNEILDDKMRVLRDHGMSKTKRYWHDIVGYNYRMTNLQAAIGLAQLERVDDIHNNRREYELVYRNILENNGFKFQLDIKNRKRITWLVSVLLDDGISRPEYIDLLNQQGIDARPFFYPLSDMDIYKKYLKNDNPVSRKISKLGLNLPTYESLNSKEDIQNIFKNIHNNNNDNNL